VAITAYPSEAPGFTLGFGGVCVARLFYFSVLCFCALFSLRPVSFVFNGVSLDCPTLIAPSVFSHVYCKNIFLNPSNVRTFNPITSHELFW